MKYEYNQDTNEYKKKLGSSINDYPIITIVLVAINIIVFVWLELNGSTQDGDYMLKEGAMYWPDAINGQAYRFVTNMFMHFGIEHLLSNIFMLAILGHQIENSFGRIKFLITYFLCGIGGSVLSGFMEARTGEYSVGAGASGAIFGIFGVLLVMIFISRNKIKNFSPVGLLVLLAVMVFGNMESNVDWLAHLGGALCGLILGAILYRPHDEKQMLNL